MQALLDRDVEINDHDNNDLAPMIHAAEKGKKVYLKFC
jgi:hypothetical protein